MIGGIGMGAGDNVDSGTEMIASKHLNWWKVAFFMALLAFELARESAVLASAEEPTLSGTYQVSNSMGIVTARGRWKRTDGGDPLVPSLVNIDCREDTGRCVEASTTVWDNHVNMPDLDYYAAKFTPAAVLFESNLPTCVKYSIRIDLKLKKVFALRERKMDITDPYCNTIERRIEMQLAEPSEPNAKPSKGHFVPLLDMIVGLVAMID